MRTVQPIIYYRKKNILNLIPIQMTDFYSYTHHIHTYTATKFTRKESYLSVSHHRIRVCLPRFRSLRPLRFIAMRLVSSALGIWKQNHILRLSLTDEPRVSPSLFSQLLSLPFLSRSHRPFTPQTLSPASFIRSVKIHLPFCWHREPTEHLSSGQCSFSRWLVNRQNTRLDNCGDRTLVRLITLHYKCIKLESNYKRARDQVSRRNLAKWLQVNASLSARNLKAMRDCRWSKANRKSENRSYTSLYLRVHIYESAHRELRRRERNGWINPMKNLRSSRLFVIIIVLPNVSIIVKAYGKNPNDHRNTTSRDAVSNTSRNLRSWTRSTSGALGRHALDRF